MHSLGLPAGRAGWESGRVQSRFACLETPSQWVELQPTGSHSIVRDNLGYPMTMLSAGTGHCGTGLWPQLLGSHKKLGDPAALSAQVTG